MKQWIAGIGILGIFVLYSIGMRHEAPVLQKPSSLGNTGSANSPQAAGSGSSGGNGSTSGAASSVSYKDGSYTGSVADAYYGNVQVKAIISGGKLTGVTFLQYPNTHSTSVMINQQAMPYLQQEAVTAQSANVQIISGATFTSQAFQQSLQSALGQAKA
jgi:uncharacterized protein with FMN-binding domain